MRLRLMHSVCNLASSGDCKCTAHHRYGRVYMRPISSNDTGNVARLLGVDERLVHYQTRRTFVDVALHQTNIANF